MVRSRYGQGLSVSDSEERNSVCVRRSCISVDASFGKGGCHHRQSSCARSLVTGSLYLTVR